jgi:hypothetical protein
MKHLLLLGSLMLILRYGASAQCVIYADSETGIFGAGYNNDNAPTSFEECRTEAIKGCRNRCGQNCTLLYQGEKKGWWAVISGRRSDGKIYIQGGDGYSSKSEAEYALRKNTARAVS